jgi:hypothetical protein
VHSERLVSRRGAETQERTATACLTRRHRATEKEPQRAFSVAFGSFRGSVTVWCFSLPLFSRPAPLRGGWRFRSLHVRSGRWCHGCRFRCTRATGGVEDTQHPPPFPVRRGLKNGVDARNLAGREVARALPSMDARARNPALANSRLPLDQRTPAARPVRKARGLSGTDDEAAVNTVPEYAPVVHSPAASTRAHPPGTGTSVSPEPPSDKGTPGASPVRKAMGLPETAGLPKKHLAGR